MLTLIIKALGVKRHLLVWDKGKEEIYEITAAVLRERGGQAFALPKVSTPALVVDYIWRWVEFSVPLVEGDENYMGYVMPFLVTEDEMQELIRAINIQLR